MHVRQTHERFVRSCHLISIQVARDDTGWDKLKGSKADDEL